MVRLRAEKVRRIADDLEETPVFGDPDGEVLLVGWGSTRGAMEAAVNTARARGLRVGTISLRWVNPIPNDIATICGRFKHLVVPELNNGQLVRLLRDQLLLPFQSVTKIQGLPFKTAELVEVIESAIASKT
jgi:2-oxoglutarate ferredoxin oxidoreductase subunit alpha